jgi:catalase
MEVTLQRQLHDKSGSQVRRAQHPKHQGLAKGELVVEADLPHELRHGICSDPNRYPVWLRFSNGRGKDDTRPTLHGLAMKVTALEQETVQDFLMVDHPVFFNRNLEEYVALFEAQGGVFRYGFSFPV